MATISYSWATVVNSFVLNVAATGNQGNVAVAATADGGYLGAWSVNSTAVNGRYVDADGLPVAGDILINTTTTGDQFDPSTALLSNGRNVVSFTDHSSGTDTVRIRILGDGAPALDFPVPAADQAQRESDVAAVGSGFAVAYTRDYGGGDTDVRVQRYDADGNVIGGSITVDNSTALATDHASITGLASGGFVVAWEQSATAGGNHSVWFQLYDSAGTAVTVAGDTAGSHHLIDDLGSINQDIQVAALQDGGFVVAYIDNAWAGGDGTEITTKIYNADGMLRRDFARANDDVAGNQLHPTVSVLSNGYFVVGWVSENGDLTYQTYDPSGTKIGGNSLMHIDVIEGETAALADGTVASVRESFNGDGSGTGVRSTVHALTRTTIGDATDETLAGDGLRDIIVGGEGNDILDGFGATDVLAGGGGTDTLRGGAGGDQLDGGAGIDTASYYTSAAGVTVDLAAGTGSGGDAAGDTLIVIENLSGSNLGNDTLLGDADANWLRGWNGDDTLRGGTGADTLDGGAGVDTASYYNGSVGVTVDLAAGTGSDGNAAGDTLTAIENISGSQGGDTLLGSAGANWLRGWNGDDVLRGGAGADTLDGGTGIDTASYYNGSAGVSVSLTAGTGSGGEASADILSGIENVSGSQGNDILVGNADANVLRGWDGDDVLNGVAGQDTLTGGIGADRFVVGGAAQSPVGGADLITDFSHAQTDRIDLHLIDANTDVAGDQAFSFIGTAAYSGVAGQLRYAVSGGVTTLAGDVDGDGTSDFHVKLTGSIALVAADFVL